MKKLRKFGSGGMPPIGDSVASGNRVSKQVGEETKRMMPPKRRSGMPPIGDSVASGNRMSKENAKDLKAVTKAKGGKVKAYAKGGKVKKYADGDLVMGGADTSGLSLGLDTPTDIGAELRRAMTDKELMDANLAAVRAREAASMAKPKPKAAAPAKKPSSMMSTAKEDKEIVVTGRRPSKPAASDIDARARQIMKERETSFTKRPLTMAEAREEASKKRISAPSETRGYASRGASNIAERNKMVAERSAKTAAQKKADANRSEKDTPWYRSLPAKKAAGGKVKTYAKGGAAKRADGIARKGHTKGKMV